MKLAKTDFTPHLTTAAVLALSIFAALLLAGCSEPAAQEAPPGPPPITVAAAIAKPVVETQEYTGRLEAVDNVQIRPRVSGFISEVRFTPGALVKAGQVLFVIDPRPYQLEANRLEAALLSARAKADLAKTELARADKLLAEKAIPQRDADEKSAAYKELDAAARAAQAALDTARLNLAFTRVHSPIDGRVSKAEVTAGNLVDGNVVLTSVVSNNPIYASFDGDEATYLRAASLARAGRGSTVRIGLANETGFPHEGKLEFVDNRVDPATGSVRMRALLKNPDAALAPGLFARVQLAAAGGKGDGGDATLIAERAIGTDQDRKFVLVVGADGKAQYRQVTLGPVIDGLRVVRTGLNAGEKIVVAGLQRVQPGSPVNAQTVAMESVGKPQAAASAEKASATRGAAH
ncbi:MAG TPA: efflux RND transporter periplasmic adaptor subunit [Burkholderiaceae bacterium]